LYYNIRNKKNTYTEDLKMTNEQLFKLLKKETYMTDHDIQKHIKDGIVIPDMWDKLEIVGDYRMDFAS